MKKWKWIGLCALAGLLACGPVEREEARWMEPGVSRELARFRKASFTDVRYRLYFVIPEAREETLYGSVEVTFRVERKQPVILDFRAEERQMRAVNLNGVAVPYTLEDEHIRIEADLLKEGENTVEVSFTPADQSLNRRDEFLYTLLVPDRARTLFPCFDQPDMKSRYTLSLEMPKAWQAVSNAAVEYEDTISFGAGRKLVVFRETEPLSTYLFSFVAGRFTRETYEREGRAISIYHRESDPRKVAQCPDIAAEVFDALEWQEAFTGIPYPFAKYDLIILPGFQFGGMEHTGATLYNDRRMFLDERPTLNERLGRSALIAHETSHMWFGDYVTMEWFDDVWTKEVFANYFASRIVEPLYPGVNHRLNFVRDYIPAAYAEDRTAGANPIKQDLDNLRNAGLAPRHPGVFADVRLRKRHVGGLDRDIGQIHARGFGGVERRVGERGGNAGDYRLDRRRRVARRAARPAGPRLALAAGVDVSRRLRDGFGGNLDFLREGIEFPSKEITFLFE